MVSTGAKVAIGVGAAAAAIGAIFLATKAQARSGVTCVSPDVKENLLGQCPSGYQPDPSSIGCCEPVTTSCNCPSGDICEPSSGCPSGYEPDPSNTGCCMPVTTSCSCASPDVCPDSSGSCPSGYTADSANPGCCKAVSPPSPVQVTFVANFPGAVITVGGTAKTANSSGEATFTLNSDTPYSVSATKTVCQPYSGSQEECCLYHAYATYTTSAASTETVDITLVRKVCRIA